MEARPVRRSTLIPALLLACALPAPASAHHDADAMHATHIRAAVMERVSRDAERWERVRHWRALRVRTKRRRVHALRTHRARLRAQRLRARLYPPGPAVLNRIAGCESGGNPRAIGGGGRYRGKYQFDRSTWASVGGHGDPAAAPESEQDYRAALLYRRRGAQPWPICGR